MQTDTLLDDCLRAHQDLLKLERSFHQWLQQMTGFEDAPPQYA